MLGPKQLRRGQQDWKTRQKPDTTAQNMAPRCPARLQNTSRHGRPKHGSRTWKHNFSEGRNCELLNVSPETLAKKLKTMLPIRLQNTAKTKHGSPKLGSRTGKHHASEGRRSHKEALKNYVASTATKHAISATLTLRRV